MTAPAYLCTQKEVEYVLSAEGVRLRLDRDGDGAVNAEEQAAGDYHRGIAAYTIYWYTWAKYDPTVISGNPWVNNAAAILAAYSLCGKDGNPVPQSLVEKAEKIEDLLKSVQGGPGLIPFAPLRRRLAPIWSNVVVDPRYQFKIIRVETPTSSTPGSGVPQIVDWSSTFSYEI